MVDKYISIFLVQLRNIAEYKFNLYLKFIRAIVMAGALAALWWVLFAVSPQETIGGFTFKTFVIYLLIIRFIATFSPGAQAIGVINEEVRSGNILMRLVRPINYLKWITARSIALPLVSGFLGIFLVVLYSVLFTNIYPIGWMLVLFMLSIIAALAMQYGVALTIAMLSFWIYEIWPVERIYITLRSILSGELIPLTLFSPILQTIFTFLPFASIAFIPAGIYVGLFSTQRTLQLIGIQLFWAIALLIIATILYKKGVKYFEAQGG